MRLNNQAKVGLTAVICLLIQGYIFTYVLKVEPHFIFTIAPLILYIAYIYAKGKRVWMYDRPMYWIAGIIALMLIDLAPFVLQSGRLPI
jgi:ABC-type iron transport system FetAB permease component